MKKRMFSALLAAVLLLTLLPGLRLASFAAETSGSCGANVKWSFNESTGVLTISGSGPMQSYGSIHSDGLYWYSSEAPWQDLGVTSAVIKSGVTTVGGGAFSNCTSLTKLTLPASVTAIESGACYYASGLTRVEIPNSECTIDDKAFYRADQVEICGNADSTAFTFAMMHGCTFRDRSTGDVLSYRTNANAQDYSRSASPVKSYLYLQDGNPVRVEPASDQVCIEQYNSSLQAVSHKTVSMELPLFGGFFHSEDGNFLVFGQENSDQDDNREVFRVVKYSKDWKRVAAASVYGANTTWPFAFGSLRMAQCGDMLYVATCHQMYTSSDGRRHQANATFSVRISDMTVTDQYTIVMNVSVGYVSHSFNQYVLVDGNRLVTLNHGDAYPRSAVLIRYAKEAGNATFTGSCNYVSVLPFTGAVGNNYTGASLGGLAASDSAYLTVGNSILQDGTVSVDGQRNIYVTATDKNNFTAAGTTLRWLTSYADSDNCRPVSTPQLVPVSSSSFLVLWMEGKSGDSTPDTLCYTFLNGSGKQTGSVYRTKTAVLSDCQPILRNGKVLWYAKADGEPLNFYQIDPAAPSSVKVTHLHIYSAKVTKEPTCTESGKQTKTCAYCGKTVTETIPALGHKYKNGICTRCGAEDPDYVPSSLHAPEISISNVKSTGKIKLTWKAVQFAREYKIYRSRSKTGTYELMKTTTKLSYVNTTAKAGTAYYYKVRAVCGTVQSPYSTVKSRTCDLPRPVVTGTHNKDTGKNKLTWKAIAGATGYEIYRADTKTSKYALLKTVTKTSFTNTGAVSGKTYYYKVVALHSKSAANSAPSEIKKLTCDLPRPVLTITRNANGKPKVSWKKITGAVSYKVYRTSSKTGTYKLMMTTTKLNYTNTSAAAGKTYFYKVIAAASNTAANSAYSEAVSITAK